MDRLEKREKGKMLSLKSFSFRPYMYAIMMRCIHA